MSESVNSSDSRINAEPPNTESPDESSKQNSSLGLNDIIKMAIENPESVRELVSLFSKPFSEYKIKELEYGREIEKAQLEIEKAKEKSSRQKFWGIVGVVGALILGAVALFFTGILSGETVAFLFGTLAGCIITFAAKNEKVVVVHNEQQDEDK